MLLEKNIARNLISEISSVIDYDINIMNSDGIIIASTDSLRIGQFHRAAHLIIINDLPELIVRYDEEYQGCKRGTNLPLIAYGDIIGVIGITGNVTETSRYGNLIKKITELLMKDIIQLQRQSKKEQSRLFFVREWISGDITEVSEITRRMGKYEFRPTGSWQVCLLQSSLGKDAVRSFLNLVDPHYALTSWITKTGIIISGFPSSEKAESYISSLFDKRFSPNDFSCLMGNTFSSPLKVPVSYDEASSLDHIIKGAPGFYHYNDYMFDIILSGTPEQKRREFISHVFQRCTYEEAATMVSFILAYESHNGSVNAMADAMFIHKNTVQYKIKKILSATSLDLRKISDLKQLLLAASWFEDTEK